MGLLRVDCKAVFGCKLERPVVAQATSSLNCLQWALIEPTSAEIGAATVVPPDVHHAVAFDAVAGLGVLRASTAPPNVLPGPDELTGSDARIALDETTAPDEMLVLEASTEVAAAPVAYCGKSVPAAGAAGAAVDEVGVEQTKAGVAETFEHPGNQQSMH